MRKKAYGATYGVIFDLFGVVFSKGLESSIERLEAVLDRSRDEITPIYRKWEKEFDLGHINEDEFWSHINNELGTNIDAQILSNIILSGYKLDGDVLRFSERIRHRFIVVVYSNYRREWFDRLDKIFHVSNYFQSVFISSDTGLLKPNPSVFDFVSKAICVPLKNLILIDNEPRNIEAAEKVGARGILFNTIDETEIEFTRLFDHYM